MSEANGTAMVLSGATQALTSTASDPRMALEPRSFQEGMRLAEVVVQSGMFGVKNAADAFVRISTGVGLGLTAAQSLRGIYVINGKPGISSDLMMGLARSAPDCEYFRMVESTPTKAAFTAKRKSDPQPTTMAFTLEDAQRAGLTNNAMYTKYPAQMLRARCVAALARLVFPERMHGLYTPDELKTGEVPDEEIVNAEFTETPSAPQVDPFEALVMEASLALSSAQTPEDVERLSEEYTPKFKTAPAAVRKTVANAFKAARARFAKSETPSE